MIGKSAIPVTPPIQFARQRHGTRATARGTGLKPDYQIHTTRSRNRRMEMNVSDAAERFPRQPRRIVVIDFATLSTEEVEDIDGKPHALGESVPRFEFDETRRLRFYGVVLNQRPGPKVSPSNASRQAVDVLNREATRQHGTHSFRDVWTD